MNTRFPVSHFFSGLQLPKPIRQLLISVSLAAIGVMALLVIFGQTVSHVSAAGNVLYVATTGNDTGSCNLSAAPCATIQYAVNQATAGDEIRVATGVYTGVQTIGGSTQVVQINNKDLTLVGGFTTTNWTTADSTANPTIIDAEGQGQVFNLIQAGTTRIEGFILQNGSATRGAGIYIESGQVTLQDNIIRYNRAISNGGAIYDFNGNTAIIHNKIYSNSTSALSGGGAIANTAAASTTIQFNEIYSNTASNGLGGGILNSGYALIEGNTIHHNTASFAAGGFENFQSASAALLINNIFYANTSNSGGAIYNGKGMLTIWHNTIVSNTATNANNGGGIYNEITSTLKITNSIVMSNTNGGIVNDGTATADHNAIQGNTGGDTGGVTETNAVTGAAMFVDPANGDFHLQIGSALIDKGTPNTPVTTDIDGEPRPSPYTSALGFDLGADEVYGSGSCYARLNDGQVYIDPQTAIGDAATGDTVKLAGTCTNSISVDKSITVQGGYTLTNWTDRTFGPTLLDGGGISISGSAITPTIDGLYITNATDNGITIGGGAQPTVQNNVIFGNNGDGIATAATGVLRHNTIYGNIGSGIDFTGGALTIANNLIINNGTGISGTVNLTVFANDIFGNTAAVGGAMSDPAGTNGNIAVDPSFADAANGNFHLSTDSPVLGYADDTFAAPADFEGDVRPQGQHSDIGADEATVYPDVRFAPDGAQTGVAGGAPVVYSHQLTNFGSIADTFNITFTNFSTWTVTVVPSGTVSLNSGESQTVQVTVQVPADAPPGITKRVVVTATSQTNGAVFDTVTDDTAVRIQPGADFTPAYTEYVDPGKSVILSHVLTNTGNYTDTFVLTLTYDPANLTGDSWGTLLPAAPYTETIAAGPYTYTLAQGAAMTVRAVVTVPQFAAADLENTFFLHAESQADQGGAPHFTTLTTDTIIANAISGDRYISPAGNDNTPPNNCTVSDQPCATIKRGLETVSIGNTVFVAQGTYFENNLRLNGNITLQGGWNTDFSERDADPAQTIIDGQNTDRVLWVLNGNPTIEGFTIRNGNIGARGGGLYIDGNASPTVNGNIFHQNTAGSGGGGIAVNNGSPVIKNNVLFENNADSGGGIYIATGNGQLVNNTIISNTVTGYGGGVYNAGGNTLISNTIVVSNTADIRGGGVYNAGGSISMDYNDFFGNRAPTNADSNAATGGHSLAVEPDLADIAGLNFHVNVGSPLVDAGDPATDNPVDFEGDARPVDQGFDIGADELAGCLAKVVSSGRIYGSVQQAVNVATTNDTVRISGYCRGVHPITIGGQTISQTVHLTKAVNLQGGWNSTFDRQDQPNAIFDAENLGRTLFISGTISPAIERITFTNGDATGLGGSPSGADAGGAVYIFDGTPSFEQIFVQRSTAEIGGGVYNRAGSPIFTGDKAALSFNRILSNTATLNGGGFYNESGNPQFDNTFFFQNAAINGGGFYNAAGQPYFDRDNNHIYLNQASLDGGGFFNAAGGPVFNADSLYQNDAGRHGGAFYNRSGQVFTITNMVVFSNTAVGDGGAFYNFTGNPVVWNVTVSQNSAGGNGGGWYNRAGTPQVINTIFAENSATAGGGIYDLNQGTIRRYNDVYGNTGGDYGNISAATGSIAADPLFVNPAGGDFHLLDGSPAIDAADPNTWVLSDIDGNVRPGDQGFDIGADEFSECFAIINDDTSHIFGSIQSALNASTALTDTIKVAGHCRGIQTQWGVNATVFVDKSRTIQGGWRTDFSAQDRTTTVDAGFRGHVFYIVDGVSPTIENFDIIHGNGSAVYNLSAQMPTVRQSRIYSNTGNTGAAIFNAGGNLTADGNRIFTNTATVGAAFFSNGGIPMLQNNFIYQNHTTDSSEGGAVYVSAGSARIRHNTLVANIADSGFGAGVYRAGGTPDIRNNIVVDSIGSAMHNGGGAGSVGYNLLADNSGGDGTLSAATDLHTRPTFVDAAAHDYHLDPASAGIDSGAPALFGLLLTDIDGDIRPSNQGMDIGADEIGGCYARLNENPPIYGSPQYAVSLAGNGDVLDIAGTCTGVNQNGGSTQNLFLDKNITVRGGWEIDFSARDTFTTLDAGGNGRGVTLNISGGTPALDRFRITRSNGGAVVNENTNGTVKNNVIYGNTAVNGAGLVNNGGNLQFWHNTIFSNTATGNGGAVYVSAGSPVIHNNIFAQNQAADGSAVFVAGGSPDVDYNNPWANTGADYGGISAGANDVTDNPLFVSQNPADGTFMKLDKFSPVIDAGDPASTVGDDFESQVRPSNLGFDMGADEYAVCLAKVDSSGEIFGHPQDAVNAAANSDTIYVAGECQIREGETQVVLVDKNLTFSGGWDETFSTRDPATPAVLRGTSAVNSGRVVVVNSGITASFEMFTLRDGTADNGGAISNAGTLYLLDPMTVISNTATANGGAIYNTGTLYLNDDGSNDGFFISGNTAAAGGAIYNTGTIETTGVEAPSGNTALAGNGGGIYNTGTLNMYNGLVSSNGAPNGAGGGIFNTSTGIISLTNIFVGYNTANSDGGGVHNNGSLDMNFDTLRNNRSDSTGGAIFDGGILTLHNSIVYSNSAPTDGGIHSSGTPSVAYTDFYQNSGGNGVSSCPNCRFDQDPLLDANYIPANTSPVIDTADPASTLTEDCCGNGRPHNAGYDRGMYEVELTREAGFTHDLEGSTVAGDSPTTVHTKYADPGTTITFTHRLQNTGSVTDTFDVGIASSSQGWSAVATPVSVTLASGAYTDVLVAVTVPPNALGGEMDTSVISITSRLSLPDAAFSASEEGRFSLQLTDRTIVNAVLDFRISNNTGAGAPGETITYTHIVTNAGNVSDTLDIFLDPQYADMALVSPPTLTVPISDTRMLTITITLPDWVAGSIDDTGYVIIRPQHYPDAETAGADTTAISYTTGTRYVSLTGNDGDNSPDETVKWNNCTNPTVAPCRTFAHALAQAAPGDTIAVAAGTYTQTITATVGSETVSQILYLDKPLTVRGGYSTADWTTSLPQTRRTILQPSSGRGVFITGTNAITLDGLTITGSSTAGYSDRRGGAIFNGGGNLTVLANTLHANNADSGGAIFNTGALTIANSVLYDNIGSAIYTVNGDTLAEYNTFYANNTTGNGGAIYHNGGTLTVQSNIFITNTATTGGAIYVSGATATIDTNDFFGTGNDVSGATAANSLSDNPLLVNPAGGDFHLTKGSPVEDAGLTPLSGITDDFERNQRPQIGYDLGADERQHVPGVTIAPDRSATVGSGNTIIYTHLITNTGEDTDTIDLTTHSSRGWADFSQVPLTVTLAAGQSVPVTVTVTAGTIGGQSDTAVITATSERAQQAGQPAFDTATDVTTVRQTFGVQFAPDRSTGATADSTVTFTHTLTNTGNGDDTFGFTADSSAGWAVQLPAPVTLSPAETRTVTMTITVPAGSGGISDVTTITATSQISPTGAVAAVADTVSVPLSRGVMFAPNRSTTGVAGSTVSFEHTITNTGNAADTFNLTAISDFGWAITLIPTQTTLAAGGSADILTLVDIPAGTPGGITDTETLTATSINDAAVLDTVVDHTETITPAVVVNPPQNVTIIGVTAGVINTDYVFSAQVSPADTGLPLTYTWRTTDQPDTVHTMSSLFDQATFNWATAGAKTIAITVTNAAGTVVDSHTVTITLNTQPPAAVSISGVTDVALNTAATFTATVSPPDTTQPLTYTWRATDQTNVTHAAISALTDAVAFTWATTGTKIITVTAENNLGAVVDTHLLTVTVAPQAPASVQITGAATGFTGRTLNFTADVLPANTATPLTYTWRATDQTDVTHAAISALTDAVAFTWATTGTKIITVTVNNSVGSVFDTHTVSISVAPPTFIYLPLIFKNYTPPNPTPTPIATNTPTPAPTDTPLPTATPSPTDTPLPTATPTATDTPLPTATVTGTLPPTPTGTATPTDTPAPTDTPTPTATPVMPDLVVTDIRVEPNPPNNGSAATVFVTIKNQGLVDVTSGNNFWVDFYVNPATVPTIGDAGVLYWGVQGADMTAGATLTFTAPYTFTDGTAQLYALADSGGNVLENNETNNLLGPISLTVNRTTENRIPMPTAAHPLGTPTPVGSE